MSDPNNSGASAVAAPLAQSTATRNRLKLQFRRNTAREPANVSLAQTFLSGKARNLRPGIRRRHGFRLQQRENLFFNRQFARVRQFVAVAGENLDPVIGPGIVRSRNHHPSIEPLRPRQKRHARRGNHACASRFHAHRRQPSQKSVGNPAAGDACVLSNYHPRLGIHAHQIVPQRPPDPINAVICQRKFARHATNPVSTEKLSGLRHESVCRWSLASASRSSIKNPRTTIDYRPTTVLLFLISQTFHDNRHANRSGVHNLDQGIWYISLRHESSPRHGSASVYWICGGRVHRFDAALRSRDHDFRRIGDHLRHSHAAREIPVTRGRTSTMRLARLSKDR